MSYNRTVTASEVEDAGVPADEVRKLAAPVVRSRHRAGCLRAREVPTALLAEPTAAVALAGGLSVLRTAFTGCRRFPRPSMTSVSISFCG